MVRTQNGTKGHIFASRSGFHEARVPMHEFLNSNRDELIRRCEAKVAGRPRRAATAEQLKNGIPLFIERLIHTLQADRRVAAAKPANLGSVGRRRECGVGDGCDGYGPRQAVAGVGVYGRPGRP